MSYGMYETQDDYSKVDLDKIVKWFSTNIGTDYEINESASGEPDEYYALFIDLTPSEVVKVRNFENWFRDR